ncbi:serine/threonine-protein phosphatase 4 regulatory subunit 2-A-like [Dendronephthya gigantea]|uniref:serine/threonine-protein phosphatase 4 regulatory subunit 2-A-like n=1 Tax=Dendronephthya gigantea TaxID=151771 RepID=UPI00106BA803|nr:serine/threonine-protein phosphatase 4 regulatory subunit 2-A-like [Dendronephthya gigantea]
MDNLETVLQCLNDFERAKDKKIGPELDKLLSHIAKTGRTEFPWPLLKPLIAYKLERVVNEFFENTSSNAYNSEPKSKTKDLYPDAQKLISNVNHFSGTPFTIQRLCELITEPQKYYRTTDKFLRGIEKNIMVVSTVQTDGSLITRSMPTAFTNGDLSPTKPDTAPTSPNLAPLNNSPLNSITQDNNTSPASNFKVELEEKNETQIKEENSVNVDTSDSSVNTAQDSKNTQEQFSVISNMPCSDSGEVSQKEVESGVETQIKDNAESCVENGTNKKTVDEPEKVDDLGNNETTDEKEISEEEKMDES